MSKTAERENREYITPRGDELRMRVVVSGDYALFSIPNISQKVSLPVITPTAAAGLLSSIYWHPGVEYCITKIHVLSEENYESRGYNGFPERIKGKEFEKAIKNGQDVHITKKRTQYSKTFLVNPKFAIEFYIVPFNNEENNHIKATSILCRRLRAGETYRPACFGIKKCTCSIQPLKAAEQVPKSPVKGIRNYGMMPYKWIKYGESAQWYQALSVDGIIDVEELAKSAINIGG